MIIITTNAVVNRKGTVFMIPEQPEDVYSLISCLCKGDVISIPFVMNKSNSKIMTEFYVIEAEYDQKNSIIHIHGRLKSEKIFQNFDIKENSRCKLTKKIWSKSDLDSLLMKSSDTSDLALLLIPEKGLADILLARKTGLPMVCAKIKGGKHLPGETEANYSERFFRSILTAFQKHVDFETIKHVVIAGPARLRDKFYSFLFAEAKRLKLKSILDNESRFILVPTDSRDFKEIMEMEAIKNFVKRTDDIEHSNIMNELDFLIATDPNRACYGWKSVGIANKLAVIRTLLVTDDLLRSSTKDTRKKYGNLIESVKQKGGTTHVLFSNEDSGKRLGVLTGVAAILRYCVLDLDDIKL